MPPLPPSAGYGPPAQALTWVKTTSRRYDLALNTQGAIERTRRKALSPSTSKSMDGCAASWAYSKLYPEQMGPFDPAPIGTSVHEMFEGLYALPPAERDLGWMRAYMLDAATELFGSDANPDFGRWIWAVRQAGMGLLQVEDPCEVDAIALEQKLECEIEGIPFTGTADRISRGADGELFVDDYKTSGKLPNLYYGDEHGDQIRLYRRALDVIRPELKVAGGRLLYTRLGTIRDDVDVSETAVQKTVATFASNWRKHNKYHEAGLFPTKVSALCGWCPLVNSCPMAAAAGKSASDRLSVTPEGREQLGIEVIHDKATWTDQKSKHVNHTQEDEDTVSTKTARAPEVRDEEQPWKNENKDGQLNFASWAAQGLFSIQSAALAQLHAAEDPDLDAGVTGDDIQALMDTFVLIICDAQEELTGGRDLGAGINARLRYALLAHLETNPFPVRGSKKERRGWVEKATDNLIALGQMVEATYTEPPEAGSAPWESIGAN